MQSEPYPQETLGAVDPADQARGMLRLDRPTPDADPRLSATIRGKCKLFLFRLWCCKFK